MRKGFLFLVLLLAATTAFAQQQIRTPRQSPQASMTQTVGTTDVEIKYSRPGVRGRTIWGDLVPYDAVWRTGANEATTIRFSEDVEINGQKLPKGTYSLHTIPGREEWTIIFNSVADQWGSYSYDEANDVLRVKAKPQRAEFREWMTFEVPEMTTDTGNVVLRWENLAVPFTVDTNTTERTMAQFRNAMQPDWRTPFQAANFAFEAPGAATDAEIQTWLDRSLQINENISNLWLKARLQQRQGNTAEAIRTADRAIAAATPQQKNFADFIRGEVAKWRK